MGRMCRVCLIWLWSNAATRMKTPLVIGTSYALPVSRPVQLRAPNDRKPSAPRI
jgi:hypothetical protein